LADEKMVPEIEPSVVFADEKDGAGEEDRKKKSEDVDEALCNQDGCPDAVSESLCSPGEDGAVCSRERGDEGWLGRGDSRRGEQTMSGQEQETAAASEGDKPETTPQRGSEQPTAEHGKAVQLDANSRITARISRCGPTSAGGANSFLERAMAGHAFVCLVSSDGYLPGALTQAAALRDLHPIPPPFQILCLVTPETVSVATIRALRSAFDLVIGVEVLEQHNNDNLLLLGQTCLISSHPD